MNSSKDWNRDDQISTYRATEVTFERCYNQ